MAVARPIPVPAPVMKATLPASLGIDLSSRLQKFETAGGRRFGSDIVALSKAWENVMADTRPFDPALLGDAAIEPQRRS
jgi:hypothetical protein